MTPYDYLKAIRRRWAVVALCVALGTGGGAVLRRASPGDAPTSAPAYVASAVILSSEERAGIANLATMAALVGVGEVPKRVARALDHEDPVQLAAAIQAVGESGTGLLTITATSTDPQEASQIANTFARELLAYVDEQQSKERETQLSRLQLARDSTAAEIDRLEQELLTASPDEAVVLGAQLSRARGRLQLFNVEIEQISELYEDSGAKLIQSAEAHRASSGGSGDSGPPPVLLLLIGPLLGCIAGVGLVLVLEQFDSRIRTKEGAESHFGLPVASEIPLLPRRKRRHAATVVASLPRTLAADSFRLLANCLLSGRGPARQGQVDLHAGTPWWDEGHQTTKVSQHRDHLVIRARSAPHPESGPGGETSGRDASSVEAPKGRPPKVVLVVSASLGDGKTTVATNLASTFAEMERRVALVSCDFHRPALHKALGIEGARGLIDAVISPDDSPVLDRVRAKVTIEDLEFDVVPTGSLPERPAEVLSSANMHRFLREARAAYDVVVIDTAPILSVSDATALLPHADAVVVVARAGKTAAAEAEQEANLLRGLDAPSTWVVLNRAKDLTIWSREPSERRRTRRARRVQPKAVEA